MIFDDFDSPSHINRYSIITGGTNPTIDNKQSCVVITAGDIASGYYAYLTPHQPTEYTNYYGAKMWASFKALQTGKAYPEIGFYNSSKLRQGDSNQNYVWLERNCQPPFLLDKPNN